jgi:hypothetical protein
MNKQITEREKRVLTKRIRNYTKPRNFRNEAIKCRQAEQKFAEINSKNTGGKVAYDMNKYNGQLSKNIGTKDKIGFKFFDVEVDFKDKLKQLKKQSMKLELEIEVLREEKADTLTQILEVERQIHLWEREINC